MNWIPWAKFNHIWLTVPHCEYLLKINLLLIMSIARLYYLNYVDLYYVDKINLTGQFLDLTLPAPWSIFHQQARVLLIFGQQKPFQLSENLRIKLELNGVLENIIRLIYPIDCWQIYFKNAGIHLTQFHNGLNVFWLLRSTTAFIAWFVVYVFSRNYQFC